MEEIQEKIIRVGNTLGIHARPAGKISQEAQRYESAVSIHSKDGEADAKSILDILALAAPQGAELTLRAQGPDAKEAVRALSDLFADMFGEKG
ncbi:MAG: HPr family phosphocarrier protein [Pseudomonadota bacterium]|nr:HPr family phosphocarrier protein [Pseudomonadota bacterium]